MADKNERRSYDDAINEIAINVNTVMIRQEDYIKQIDRCAEQTSKNKAAIGTLKTKMNFVTWAGSAISATGLFVVGKWAYKHFS